MPVNRINRTDLGAAMGNLGASLISGFGANQGRMDGYRQLSFMNQAEKAGLEAEQLRREMSRNPRSEAIRELGLSGGMADDVGAMLYGNAPQNPVDENLMQQAYALVNVFDRGGKVDDITKAIGDSQRNVIARRVNPDNVADIGAQIGATEGKPLEGFKTQLMQQIAQGGDYENLGKALLAGAGKGVYENMGAGGVYNELTGQQNLNDIGRSNVTENLAQAESSRSLAQQREAKTGGFNVPSGVNVKPSKPLPTQALKMVQGELDALGTIKGTTADIETLSKQLDEGALDLSLIGNMENKARNFVGASNDKSRAYDQFMSTLEKMRNDTLLLAKGVQTEGDAQRAWNQLMSNPNDSENVKQQLKRIKEINERSANIRAMNIDNIRSNYGLEPMDLGGYINQPSAIQNDIPMPQSSEAVQFDISPETWQQMPIEQKQQIVNDARQYQKPKQAEQTKPSNGWKIELVK